jgi:hypothetical protein
MFKPHQLKETNTMTLSQYKALYLTPDNAMEYAQTQDKYLFVEYLTDLPTDSKMLERLDRAFFEYAIDHFMIESI